MSVPELLANRDKNPNGEEKRTAFALSNSNSNLRRRNLNQSSEIDSELIGCEMGTGYQTHVRCLL